MLAEPPRPPVPQQLDRVWRWSLWDYTDATKLIKVIIGVPPHRYTNRAEAARALGYQHRADSAGHMYARAGIALSVNPSDAQRLAPWLSGIEVFVDPGLPDLPIVLPEALGDPVATNGQPPTNGQTQTPTNGPTPNGPTRTRKLGVILGKDVVAAIRIYSTQQQVLVKQVLDQMAREFFERHGWPPVLTADGAPQAGRGGHTRPHMA